MWKTTKCTTKRISKTLDNIEEILAEEQRERLRAKITHENKLSAEIVKLYEILQPMIANTESQVTTKQESA